MTNLTTKRPPSPLTSQHILSVHALARFKCSKDGDRSLVATILIGTPVCDAPY